MEVELSAFVRVRSVASRASLGIGTSLSVEGASIVGLEGSGGRVVVMLGSTSVSLEVVGSIVGGSLFGAWALWMARM